MTTLSTVLPLPETLLGNDGVIKERKINLMERMPGIELAALLDYEDRKVIAADLRLMYGAATADPVAALSAHGLAPAINSGSCSTKATTRDRI